MNWNQEVLEGAGRGPALSFAEPLSASLGWAPKHGFAMLLEGEAMEGRLLFRLTSFAIADKMIVRYNFLASTGVLPVGWRWEDEANNDSGKPPKYIEPLAMF